MCLAIPGKIVGIEERKGMRAGRVEFGGIIRQACLDLVPEAVMGDYVLVHVGFAITRVDRGEAERTFGALKSMGALEAEFSPAAGETEG